MHDSHDSGRLPQFTAFGHIFSPILQVTAAIEQGGNDDGWAKSELEPRMRQKHVTGCSGPNPALFGRNSLRLCSRSQQGERVVMGDAKQGQVPRYRSSLSSFCQQDAASTSGCVWPLLRCAPWVFGGDDAKNVSTHIAGAQHN